LPNRAVARRIASGLLAVRADVRGRRGDPRTALLAFKRRQLVEEQRTSDNSQDEKHP
jgi:hypothetical protein